ncbi:ABC transporter substrate-binding protein [Paenibacillus chitinolyticus]|uniref:ABC transporter substrate-binding protein n=1 Tax=Paenibacillus chitinolyticus TaxID=79263 RepID=UPI0035DA3F5D
MKKIKYILLVTSLAAILLLLAACSSNEIEQQSTPNTETKTFKHESGETVVPVHPQRVASDQYMGQLLKLGIKPIGVRDNMLTEPWIKPANLEKGALDGIKSLGGFPLNLEALTSLNPDVIISSLPDNIESYSKIAPTVHIPYASPNYSSPMDKFFKIAELFDKTEQAKQWIDQFEQEAARVQEQILQSGKIKKGETVSVMGVFNKNVYVFGPKGSYGGSMIYDYVKLQPTPQAEQLRGQTFHSAQLSLETVPEYMGDHAFFAVIDEAKGKELMESSFWKTLPAVANNQVYFYDSPIFAMDDPYSMEAQLKIIHDLFMPTAKQ